MPTDERTPETHEQIGLAAPTAPRSRRALLTAAAAAGGALATQALVRPSPVSAANVVLGAVNTAGAATTIRNTQALISAKALIGLVTTTIAGPSTAGVQGQSNATNGNGLFGVALSGPNAKGVWGRSAAGTGVYGEGTATAGSNYGVRGVTPSSSGVGVQGIATATSGTTSGVFGRTHSGNGNGVHGLASNAAGFANGVFGQASSPTGAGVYGTSPLYGVAGFVPNNGSVNYGVYGQSFSAAGFGGYFDGRVHVTGNLTKGGGGFLIDHQQDPANKTLEHSFVEAPERLNIYRGNVVLDANGRATVRMPGYFRTLNADYSYQLTAVDAPAPSLHVARKVTTRSFAIAGGAPGQEVCWQVTGVRQDAWAQKHPLRVERTKKRKDRGKYLNPELFGKPRSAAIHALPKVPRRPRRLPRSKAA